MFCDNIIRTFAASVFINAGKHNLSLLFSPVPSRLALGVEDRRIPDGGFSASSSWDRNHGPKRARLNIIRRGRLTGAWSSRANNRAQWLLIDITKMARVVGFAIQGRQDNNQWVMSLRISYSRDGIRFRYYTERRRAKVCSYPCFILGGSCGETFERFRITFTANDRNDHVTISILDLLVADFSFSAKLSSPALASKV